MPSRRTRSALLTAALLCSLPAASAVAQVGPIDPDQRVPDDTPASQAAPPQAVAMTGLAPRAAASSSAWDPRGNTYADGYVRPSSWRFDLDACASRGRADDSGSRAPLREYRWSLEPLDGQSVSPIVIHSATCRKSASLRALGRWRVSLTIQDVHGETDTTSQSVTLRDKLVVAFGDSYASGEGNPESEEDVDDWVDAQCHRSDAAWPARVARSLERRTTAVTFVSFACSGAAIGDLTERDYRGAEPAEKLPPQLVAARRLLGDPLDPDTRQADAVLVSAGVNDLGFASIITDCATRLTGSCRVSLEAPQRLLSRSYDELEAAISANLRAASTTIAQYPARLFDDGSGGHDACGVFSNMSDADARWVTDEGNRLNGAIADAAARHGWTAVPVTDSFRGHGYCTEDSWFRSWGDSLAMQEDSRGTAHPNGAGHEAVAGLVAPRVTLEATAPPSQRLEVRFLRVRLVDDVGADDAEPPDMLVDFTVLWHKSACGRVTETKLIFVPGQWRDLGTDPCFRFPVVTGGRSIETRILTRAGGGLRVQGVHRRAMGWDADQLGGPVQRLRVVQPGGVLEVEYRIVAPLVSG